LHRDRGNQLDLNGDIIAWHDHFDAIRQLDRSGHVGGAEIKLWPVISKERGVTPPSSLLRTYTSALNFLCGLIVPGLAMTWPRSISSFFVPRRSTPTLSPARASSRSLRNISISVAVVLAVGRMPTISTSSIFLSTP